MDVSNMTLQVSDADLTNVLAKVHAASRCDLGNTAGLAAVQECRDAFYQLLSAAFNLGRQAERESKL